jgi:hypothetical protein
MVHDRAVIQVSRLYLLIVEVGVKSRVNSCEIYGESGTKAEFSLRFLGYSLPITIPPLVHTPLLPSLEVMP